MEEQISLSKLKTTEKIKHYLLLVKLVVKTAKSGKQYLDLELRDESIALNAKMWSNFDSFLTEAKEGSIVKVLGTIDEFNNQPQIKIDRIRNTTEDDKVNLDDFLPKSVRPISEMIKEFNDIRDSIKSPELIELLNKILIEENFNKYKRAPAGKAWHHAYIGGLLEHTLEIIKICDLMCSIHSNVNRDLILTGAILHDFGKIEELDFTSGFEYTDKGSLLGHIVIAANIIEKTASQISNFPEDIKNQLIHLVLSHQGKLEYASPVVPKTLEAIILYHADELSAKTNAYKGAIEAVQTSDANWTRFLPLAGTALYSPPKTEDEEFKDTLF
ncbi:MAG: HD domain-containing protein [Ignavibacteriae bacterium]|nr:HD domain-containing protein [Ignavibacteriota bacterium]